jgi:3-hydroxy-3-methylglutaryl CoA synthase
VDYAVFHAPFNRMTRKAVAIIADVDSHRCRCPLHAALTCS